MLVFIYMVRFIFQTYTFMLFARILSSWLPQLSEYKIVRFIAFYTDPYLNFFRKFIPPLGMIDFSPIIAFLCLTFLQDLVVQMLVGLIH